MSESGDLRMRHEVSKRRLQRAHDISFFAVIVLFFVPRAVFLLVSTMDRELWLKPKLRKSAQISDFRLSIQPQKFETITVIRGYKNGKLVRLCAVLVPSRALNPSRWPKGWQLGRGKCHCFQIERDNRCKKSLALQTHPFLVIPFHNQIGWYSCTANLTGIKLESRLNMTPLLRSGKIWVWKVPNQLSNFIFNNSYASEENIH